MREWIAYVVSILLFVPPAFAQSGSTGSGSIRGDVFTKGTNGEPAVLPGVLIVLHGPITKETESDAKGAFAVDSLPPGTYQIEANAPGLYAALATEVSASTSSTVTIEMSVAAVKDTVNVTARGEDRESPSTRPRSGPGTRRPDQHEKCASDTGRLVGKFNECHRPGYRGPSYQLTD